MQSSLDRLQFRINENEYIHPRRVFADCGAFQFRHLETPKLGDVDLDYNVAWDYYEKKHVNASHQWSEILLCSRSHCNGDMSDEQVAGRFEFIRKNAPLFLEMQCSVEGLCCGGHPWPYH